ncbi:MAG: GtrA family protein [Christensenellales bacterium]
MNDIEWNLSQNANNGKGTVKQFFKYLCFACSAGVIQILSFTLFNEVFHFTYWLGYILALFLSVVWNFTLNREFTFKSANNIPIAMLKVTFYYLIFTPLSIWWGVALENALWNEYVILAITMIVNFATEFTFCKLVVFKGSENTNKRAKKCN